LLGWISIHAALGIGLLEALVGQSGAQRRVELVDDRTRRAGGREQRMPEIEVELLVTKLAQRLEARQAGKLCLADDRVSF